MASLVKDAAQVTEDACPKVMLKLDLMPARPALPGMLACVIYAAGALSSKSKDAPPALERKTRASGALAPAEAEFKTYLCSSGSHTLFLTLTGIHFPFLT